MTPMEDSWNAKARFGKPPGVPSSVLSGQEVCVIERTIRQDTFGPNLLNFGLQGSKVARLDSNNSLFGLVSGSQQQTRSSHQPGFTHRTAFATPHTPQFQHIQGGNLGIGAWPANVPSSNRSSGCGNFGFVDFPQYGQSRETTTTHYMKMMALQDSFDSTLLRSPNIEIVRETLSQVASDNTSNINHQALFSQWSTEIVSKKQWSQSAQGSQVSQTSKRPTQQSSDADIGSSHAQSSGSSSSRLQVYCTSYAGLPISGELSLTKYGRFDVICSCHSSRMSVAKFSQHAGNYYVNPGDAVHLENGESLVQWRKTLFWQYQVKVPEDDVGWEWTETSGGEFEPAKHESGTSQSWHKLSEPIDRGSSLMNRSRSFTLITGENPSSTQLMHGLADNESCCSQQVSNSVHDQRESCPWPHGRSFRNDVNPVFTDGRFVLNDLQENGIQETGSVSSFKNTTGFGPVSEYFDFINHAGHPYPPRLAQQATAMEKDAQKSYSSVRQHIGREHVQCEKDILSSFELKLGQPSQQTQPLITPLASPINSHLPYSSIDCQKPLLIENQDGKIQQELQNPSACMMPHISLANTPLSDHRLANTHSQGSVRSNALDAIHLEIQNAESNKSSKTISPIMHSVKLFEAHMGNSSISNLNGVNPQNTCINRDCDSPMSKLHAVRAQNIGIKRAATHSSPSTGQLANEVSVKERHNSEASYTSRRLSENTPWMFSTRFFEGGVHTTGGHCMPYENKHNDCKHHPLDSDLGCHDSCKAVCHPRHEENVANLGTTDSSAYADPSPKSLIAGGSHVDHSLPCDCLEQNHTLSAENESSKRNLKKTENWHQSGAKVMESAEASELTEQVYNKWNLREKQHELNSSSGLITVDRESHHLDDFVNDGCPQQQNALPEAHLVEGKEDKVKVMVSSDGHSNKKGQEDVTTIDCNMTSAGQLSTTGTSTPRIITKSCSSSRLNRVKSSLAARDHACVSPVDSTPQEQLAYLSTLATSSGHLVSVGENEPALLNNIIDRKIKEQSNSFDEPCSALIQWKDSSKAPLKGVDQVTTCSPEEMFCRAEQSDDDQLSDTASKRVSVAADTGNHNRHQMVSYLCSKSSENVLSGFSDGEHLVDGDASQGECESKKRVLHDAVDEGSGIGKCCLSNELEPSGTANPDPPSTFQHAGKKSCSLKFSASNKMDYFCEARSTRSKRIKGITQGVLKPDSPLRDSDAGLYKVERKKRKAMKWKKLDDTMAAATRRVMDVEGVEPELNAIQFNATTTQILEQESARSSVNEGLSKKRSLISDEMGVIPKRKRMMHSSVPSLSFMDETKMLDNSVDLCNKMQHTKNNIVKVKPDVIVSKNSDNCAPLRAKSAHVNCIKLTYAPSPGKIQDFREDIERPAKAFGIKVNSSEEWLGNSQCEASATSSKEKLRHSRVAVPHIFKNPRTSFGRSTPKNTRMVSLSSILKLPIQTTKSLPKHAASMCAKSRINFDEAKGLGSVVPSDSAVRGHENEGLILDKKLSRSGVHELALSKEARKRSLWELNGRENGSKKTTELICSNSVNIPRAVSKRFSFARDSNEVAHAKTGRLGESNHRIHRGVRSARAHTFAKTNGWQSGGQANLRPCSAPGGVYRHSNDSLSMPAQVTSMKHCNKESNRNVSQSVRAFDVPILLNLDKHENHASSGAAQVDFSLQSRKRTIIKGSFVLENEPMVTIDTQKSQQSLLDKGSVATVVSRQARQLLPKRQTLQPDIDVCEIEIGLKRPLVDDHNKIVARKKRLKRFKAATLRSDNCCVCGSFESDAGNQLVNCSRCSVKVHQCCYGISKIPKALWLCRACKANVSNIVCVLCGYGGGAMTRAQKTRDVVKGLLRTWQNFDFANKKLKELEPGVHESRKGGVVSGFSNRPSVSAKAFGDNDRGKPIPGIDLEDHKLLEAPGNTVRHYTNAFGNERKDNWKNDPSEISDYPYEKFLSPSLKDGSKHASQKFSVQNTITAALDDPAVTQWVHMVCALWMPGTRCLNLGTMGVFDVSGISSARRRQVCSICKRQGGSCIQCRVPKCSTPFHVWCAHEKSLLQTEVVDHESGHVGFYGKCMIHWKLAKEEDIVAPKAFPEKNLEPCHERLVCARTQGYDGRQTSEEKVAFKNQVATWGSAAVSQEQINAWMHINERKASGRRFIKPLNADIKIDHRVRWISAMEYTRFKQEQGWRRLAVYKSRIHALGLYTAENILKGEMVVEYIGEIVGLRVADKREAEYDSGKRMQYKGACYLFRIDKENIIDATRKGGIARFVNHSCSPNCVAKVICVKNQKKVVFFAERDINAGEEITYDYHFNYEKDGDKIPCLCGSKSCRKFLN